MVQEEQESERVDEAAFVQPRPQHQPSLIDKLAASVQAASGESSLGKNDLATAETFFAEAVSLSPNNAEYRHRFATILARLDKFEDAVQHCQIACDIQPRNPGYLNDLGFILVQMEEFAKAEPYFKAAA